MWLLAFNENKDCTDNETKLYNIIVQLNHLIVILFTSEIP